MWNRDQCLEVIERVLRAAEGDEADAVFVATDRNVSRFANSGLHQNMSEISGDLTLRVIADGRMGVASSSSVDQEEIQAVARLALDTARRSEPVPGFRGLYRGAGPAPELPTWDEATAKIEPAEKARELRTMFDRGASRGVHFAGSYSTTDGRIAAGNSHGLRRFAPLTLADALVIAVDGARSGFATRASRRASAVDLPSLGDEATDRALLLADHVGEIEPGPFDIILEPPALAEIFEWMNMITFSGQSYEDGSSFFVDRLGKRALGQNLSLADDPIDPDFLPFPFDAEGLDRRRNRLVEHGVIRGPMLDKIMADRLGMPPTATAAAPGSEDHGSALHLSMAPGESSREELIASTERGIWVTRFHYLNGLIEPKSAVMTGMTRDGTLPHRERQGDATVAQPPLDPVDGRGVLRTSRG